MNDYKELIEHLRKFGLRLYGKETSILQTAANAIEQLVAERDAAVKDIGRVCAACKYFEVTHNGNTYDYDCHNLECGNISGINTGWEWRGVQDD